MKPPISTQIRLLCLVGLLMELTAQRAAAQSRPTLECRFSSGRPVLTLTGRMGEVYVVQRATDFSSTNPWVYRTWLRALSTTNLWTDVTSTDQCFYRTFSIPAPADTNLVFIPPGTFTMGSPTNEAERMDSEVQHTVVISHGFWMGKFLVTQAEYLAVIGYNPSQFQGNLNLPVEQVAWRDTTNYCSLRTQRESAAGMIPTNYVYRLPTEAEWEYACRAGTTTAFYLGSALDSTEANFDGEYKYDSTLGTTGDQNGIDLMRTTVVGSYAPNTWGLYDMAGNVCEWCLDQGVTPYSTGTVIDPLEGPVMDGPGLYHVVRGGCWYGPPRACRSASRDAYGFDVNMTAYGFFGFRVVLAPTR